VGWRAVPAPDAHILVLEARLDVPGKAVVGLLAVPVGIDLPRVI
jgi:hypothetical protein